MSQLDRIVMEKALRNEDTFATCLVGILLKTFDVDFFEWEPETLILELGSAFPGADIPEINIDKIGALTTALTTNQFYQYFEIFSNVCRSLNGEEADFSSFVMPTPHELAWGVTEVLINDVPEKGGEAFEFAPEVTAYTGFVLSQFGLYVPPKVLAFAEYSVKNPLLGAETDTFTGEESFFEAGMKKQDLDAKDVDEYVAEQYTLLHTQLKDYRLLNPPTLQE